MRRRPAIPRRRATLRRKLVLGTSALIAVALLATGAATVVALRSFVFERLDAQVLEGLDRAAGPQSGASDRSPGAQGPDDSGSAGAGSGSAGADASGSGSADPAEASPSAPPDDSSTGPAPRIGTLQVELARDGSVISSSYTADDGTELELAADQIDALAAAVPTDRVPVTVDLGDDVGSFRAAAAEVSGRTVISGNSIQEATDTTVALVVILLTVGGAILAVAVIGTSLLVRRNLRPLDRVADVAERASGRRLAQGDVEIPDRVDEADTDPDTEVGRVGTSLNALLGHVEAALAARQGSEERLRRFIADASHELRTPLASIRGYAQLSLREDAPMTPTQRRSLDRIESESERMAELVDDLLLLARLDAGQTLRLGEVELTMLAVDGVSDAHAADPARRWRLDVGEEAIDVPGDENRIRQVLANLLRNARTHTPPGTVVTTSLRREGGEAVLRVIDDGPGIDPAVRDRLFDRFARGDHARNRDAGSTGLGLSIARAITTAHGGTISVESEPGRTAFTVRLPLAAGEERAAGPDSGVRPA